MKTILFLFAVLIFGLVSCNNATSNRSVEINGVRWATSNVERPGRFARSPESAGGLFTFEEAQNACPHGWRLPTLEEFESLLSAGVELWTARNDVNGGTFGAAPNQLFLPTADFRNADGTFWGIGAEGYYWSSERGVFLYLSLRSGSSGVESGSDLTLVGFSVRCVSE